MSPYSRPRRIDLSMRASTSLIAAVNNQQERTNTTRFFIEIIPRCICSLKLDFGVLHNVYLDSPPAVHWQVHLLGRGTATEC